MSSALKWLGASAAVGAAAGGIGAAAGATSASVPVGMIGGASALVGVTAIGGLVVGLASKPNRETGFATAGIGLAALFVTNLVTTSTMAAKPATTA